MGRGDGLRLVFAVLLLGVAAAAGWTAAGLTPTDRAAEQATTAGHGLTSLPMAAQGPVSVAVAVADR